MFQDGFFDSGNNIYVDENDSDNTNPKFDTSTQSVIMAEQKTGIKQLSSPMSN
jgi:hypothetical protein